MLYRKIFSSVVLMLCLMLAATAQDAIPAAGGDASGTGGSAAYSVGQVFFNVRSSAEASVVEGVQQPYEISVVTGMEEVNTMALHFEVYPNPTMGSLILKTENSGNTNTIYQLNDINGKLLKSERINVDEFNVSMVQFAAGTYFLKVLVENNNVKTFKIIKN
jgi:opacity protein-like surface antigen